jgi:hypothetical protein
MSNFSLNVFPPSEAAQLVPQANPKHRNMADEFLDIFTA